MATQELGSALKARLLATLKSLGIIGAVVIASIVLIPDKMVMTADDKDKQPTETELKLRKVMLGKLLVDALMLPMTVRSTLRSARGFTTNGVRTAAVVWQALNILKNIPAIVTAFTSLINLALYYKEHGEFPTKTDSIIDSAFLSNSNKLQLALTFAQSFTEGYIIGSSR